MDDESLDQSLRSRANRHEPARAEEDRVGDWGARAWESDEAADWFHRFWNEGWPLVVREIEHFDPADERFDSLRAAAHVLASFGSPYMVPSTILASLPSLLDKAREILQAMIDPPSEGWAFLDMCGQDPAVVTGVEEQIETLRARRAELARD